MVQFEDRLKRLQNTGTTPDKKIAQVDRLKTENAKLRDRLTQAEQAIAELGDFRGQALARLAAQHGEIIRLRATADTLSRVARLPARGAQTPTDRTMLSRPANPAASTRQRLRATRGYSQRVRNVISLMASVVECNTLDDPRRQHIVLTNPDQ
ncbi:hypothetical protein J7E80_16765 [Arthrobacter sp. ISL-28]|nr:hypothetical protein [Arthrobacter sp. ISL-28]